MVLNPLIRISLRQSRFQPLRAFLLAFGIALGVAGVIAIDIAKTSVSRSFDLSAAAITSQSTHQIIGSDFKIPQSLFTQIRTRLGVYKSAPVVTRHVMIKELDNKTLTLMGIDPFSEIYFRDLTLGSRTGVSGNDLSGFLTRESGVLLSKTLLSKYGLKENDEITLLFGTRQFKTVISGVLDSSRASNAFFQGLILADVSLAQEILGIEDHITRIDLILTDEAMVEQVRNMLPDGVVLVETSRQNQAVRRLSKSFEISLTAFSMLALFMGIFLIYNTVSFSITRRRKLNGTLRALGTTQGDIFRATILEVMIYALVGSSAGIVLGILLGKGAVHIVCRTVSDMYFTLTVTQVHITVTTIIKGFFAGIISSFIASFFPAAAAARTLPITLMQRSAPENMLKKVLPQLTISGSLVIAGAVFILHHFTDHPGVDYISVFMIFFGSALLCPAIILFFVKGFLAMSENFLGTMMKMALRNIVRSLSRTSVLIASLMVVTSVYIGIDIMTGSFRSSIIEWIDGNIGGDIHVSSSDTLKRALSPELLEKIYQLPEVDRVSAYNIHRIFSRTSGEIHIFSYVSDFSRKRWAWTAASEEGLSSLLDQGWIFVSEIFADQHHIEAEKGARVVLETQEGPVSFRIAGIFRDFFMGGGRVIVSRKVMKQFWGYNDITALQLFLKDKSEGERVMERIKSFYPDPASARLVSGESIKKQILDVFENTFLITSALQVLTAIVALTGILNSVMALLLERKREMGILRACGAETRQVGRLLLSECGLSGFISGVLALPLGICLAWVLIDIVNKRSFGWTYDMVISFGTLFQALTLSCTAALIAGVFPAVKAAKTDIVDALHME